jgi:hypothetical protein
MRELQSRDITKLARLAVEPVPLTWKPSRGAKDGYVRSREQARIQLAGRDEEKCLHELLELVPGHGLARLPEPSPGDMFLDLEADPFVDDGGLEYLFGWVAAEAPPEGQLALTAGKPAYHAHWALDRVAEKRGFEATMDAILERWARDPGMHVYHFSPYEPGALKRLMGRHATREADMDRLLRAGRFIDLHLVVRQALRASVEEYSIKALEPLYGYQRERTLEEAGAALRLVQRGLELGHAVSSTDDTARSRSTTATTVSRRSSFAIGWRGCVPRPSPAGRRSRGRPRSRARLRKTSAIASGSPPSWRRGSRPGSRKIPRSEPTSRRRSRCSRTSSTGIVARRRRTGGSTSGSASCRTTHCWTRRGRSRGSSSSIARPSSARSWIATDSRRRRLPSARATS